MCTDRDPPPCEHGELIAEVDRLQGHNASLTATVKELRSQLAAAQRSGKRQAAPFSKGRRIDKPRRPGRKPGMGNFSYRKPPSAELQLQEAALCRRAVGAASGCVGGRRQLSRMWRSA